MHVADRLASIKATQPQNANWPTKLTEDGNLTRFTDRQELKALEPMCLADVPLSSSNSMPFNK